MVSSPYVGLDIAQLAQQLIKSVHFSPTRKKQIVTAWKSGLQATVEFEPLFKEFVDAVSDEFLLEKVRIYILQSPKYSWHERILLTDSNFSSYIERTGVFARPKLCKLYVCDDASPNGSPANGKKGVDVDEREGSHASNSSNRSGQREFRDALLRRDKGVCVFCGAVDNLEGAHYLPVEQKELLEDPAQCTRFGIGSIMDSANGILLCWACHKCFDADLVCISSESGKLVIADALLANEREKWECLIDHIPKVRYTWPSKELLKFREKALRDATEET